MLTRTTLLAAAAAIAFSGAAIADEAKGPRVLTDTQLDGVVAGLIAVTPSPQADFDGFINVVNATPSSQSPGGSAVSALEAYNKNDSGNVGTFLYQTTGGTTIRIY